MRTAPVALAYLDDEDRLVHAARAISDLTHPDPDAADACVLWCLAIRHAVLTGALDLRRGLGHLPADRAVEWSARIDEAESADPRDFPKNGWVVQALQGAWSAITRTPVPAAADGAFRADHLRLALEAAVRGGKDTDTVAAIAGSLLGARWGAPAIPAAWRRGVHGWPGLTVTQLGHRGYAVARRITEGSQWPLLDRYPYPQAEGRLVPHPHDDGILLGDAAVLDDLPETVDAVVSLCRVGRVRPARIAARDHVEVWLVDTTRPDDNPNLEFAIRETADAIAQLRSEGRTVLVHCAAAQSRTPTIGAAYAIRHLGIDPATALDEVVAALPDACPNPAFTRLVATLTPA